MRSRNVVFLAALAVLGCAGVPVSRAAPITLGGATPIRVVEVELYRGHVRVRPDARAGAVKVVAGLAAWDTWVPGSDPLSKRVKLPEGSLVMTTRGDTARIAAPTLRDLVVLDLVVPAHATLRVRIVHYGDVQLVRLLGEIEVEQFQGRIALHDVRGPVVAHIARDGDIRARLLESPAPRPMSFSTYEGDIQLEVPESLAARLSIATVEGVVRNELAATPGSRVAEPRIAIRNARGTIHVLPLR